MAGAKSVMLAFSTFGKAGQAAVLAQRRKLLPAAGNDLMNVRLMAHVKDNFILRRGKNAVQSQGKLHHAQIRR